MEYKPSLPRNNDNVSHNQPIREFILLFSGITVFLLALFWVVGLFVDHAVNYITPEMEAKIFSAFTPSEKELVKDGDLKQAELQRMVKNLSQCIHITYPLNVHLIDSKTANAVALPGGRILVFKGLLDKVESENGLSFVLAHELAHFKNRDHLRGMGRGIVITAVAALITGAGSDFTQLFAPTVNFNMAQYSQARERLADEKALQVLDCFYGHVG
ncbi:MAG: M48 family metallopeptidase, partial [Thermodesulfobacteriota bacterium]